MVEIQQASEWSGSKNTRFSCLIVCLLLKRKGLGVLGFKRNHVFFIFFKGAFWMLGFREGAICVASFKVWKCFSVGLLQTLLEKNEVDGNERPKHFQRSTNSLPKVFQSCELQNPCPPLHAICADSSKLPLFP